jgi:transglutaminase-like putative cysteine protease
LKSRDSDRIVLQIEAAVSPGYLRGQAYADYQNDTWSALPFGESMPVANRAPDGYTPLWPDANLYEVAPPSGSVDSTITVFPSPEIERAIFTPLEIAWLGYRGRLQMNEARVLQSTAVSHGQPYQALTTPRPGVEPMTEAEREKYTRLPDRLAPRIQSLSNSVCAGHKDNVSKAGAVAQYFTGNYDYTLGIQVPEGEDPLAYFLFSDPLPAAHCEFFATGAALLLRAAGVPARYVTGVGVWEQHPFADYWVARNRDAHAWVEAWDENEGWFIVEATPASGLPEAGLGQKTNTLSDLWSLFTLQVRQFLAALRDGAWRTAVEVLAAILAGLYQFVQEAWLPLVSVLALFIVLMRLVRHRKQRPARLLPQGEIARRLQRQLSVMDRTVKRRHRLERAAHVTPHAFAVAVEAEMRDPEMRVPIATWYRRWAEVRYQPEIDGAAVDRLEKGLRELKGRRKRKSVRSDVSDGSG